MVDGQSRFVVKLTVVKLPPCQPLSTGEGPIGTLIHVKSSSMDLVVGDLAANTPLVF